MTIDLWNTFTPNHQHACRCMSQWQEILPFPHPQLKEPNGTKPYHTRSHKGKISDERYTHLLINSSINTPCQFSILKDAGIKSPTTPCQFDMWNNACVPRWDVHPLLIEPSATKPYYTMSVWYVEEGRCIQVRCTSFPHTPSHIMEERSTIWCGVCICYTDMLKISYTDMIYCSFQFIHYGNWHV